MNKELVEQKESFIEQELKKFDVVESKLIELAAAGKGLTIKDFGDKKGIELVRTARIALKNERVRIEKAGKSLRDQANTFNKAVLAKEKEYLSFIVPTEDTLLAEESRMFAEHARIEKEIADKRHKQITDRIADLAAFRYVIDFDRAASLSQEDFEKELLEAKTSHEAEVKRIADEREAARIENERLQSERSKMEREAAAIKSQQDRVAKEQAEKQKQIELAEQKVRLEKESVERERRQQLENEERMKLAAERADKERLAAIESERLRVEKIAADKAETERLQVVELKRQASLAPDKEKLAKLAADIDSFELPSLSMPESEKIINDVRGLLSKVSVYINQKISTL